MRRPYACLLLVALLTALGSVVHAQVPTGPLELEHVLASLERNHPLILSEKLGVQASEAELLAARGEFDTTVSVQGRAVPAGYYDPKRVDVVIECFRRCRGAAVSSSGSYGKESDLPALRRGVFRSTVPTPWLTQPSIC